MGGGGEGEGRGGEREGKERHVFVCVYVGVQDNTVDSRYLEGEGTL